MGRREVEERPREVEEVVQADNLDEAREWLDANRARHKSRVSSILGVVTHEVQVVVAENASKMSRPSSPRSRGRMRNFGAHEVVYGAGSQVRLGEDCAKLSLRSGSCGPAKGG